MCSSDLLTLPDDDSPSNKGEDRGISKQLFIQAGRAPVSQLHSGSRLDHWPALLGPAMPARAITATCPSVSCSLLPATPRPLCDRARHERSGVQLA